jgi:predicted DNA-binding transcriptional regulator YafY
MSLPTIQVVKIRYTNYEGTTKDYRILPLADRALYFGTSRWHPEPQWLLDAWDVDREVHRTFSMKHVLTWEEEAAP